MLPVFIGGCGRSGTTLLGSMLGAHSSCVVTPESPFKFCVLPDATQMLAYITEHPAFRIWASGADPKLPQQALAGCGEAVLWVVRQYAQHHGASEASVWVDHTPTNLRRAQLLVEQFPDCKMVHILRDGRAVAASYLPLDWGPNSVMYAARWWAYVLAHCFAAELELGPERVLRVRYEDLVREPERELKRVCDHVGLEFEATMLDADGLRVPAYTRHQHRLVGQKPRALRIDAWRETLSSRQVEIFEYYAGHLLDLLQYERVCGPKPRRPGFAYRSSAALREHLGGSLRRIQKARRMRKTVR